MEYAYLILCTLLNNKQGFPKRNKPAHRELIRMVCAMSLIDLLFSFIEPQNKRTPDLPEEECVKGETKENGEADNKLFEEATPELGEAVVS